jgi:hypothetical protein
MSVSNESVFSVIGESFPISALKRPVGHALWGFPNALLSKSVVDVAHVCVRLKSWAEGRLDLLLQDHVPVDASKPRMLN